MPRVIGPPRFNHAADQALPSTTEEATGTGKAVIDLIKTLQEFPRTKSNKKPCVYILTIGFDGISTHVAGWSEFNTTREVPSD